MSDVVVGIHCTVQPDGRYAADGNAAVVVDGQPLFAVAQERVTRQKYDGGFAAAAQYALDALGLSIADVATVAVSTFGRPDAPGDAEHAAVAGVLAAAPGAGPGDPGRPPHPPAAASAPGAPTRDPP